MFENRTYETILKDMIANAPSGIDTRQGSVFYDFVAPAALMLARYYNEIDVTIDLITIDTAEGEYLDQKAYEHGLTRNEAVCNVRAATFVGASVTSNLRFFADEYYFVSKYDDNGFIVIVSETPGEGPNSILSGTKLVPVNDIEGLTAATVGDTITPGSDEEDDEHLRTRLREKLAYPAENGNRQHYKTWCESISGVGMARIDALWNGDNTVRAIIIDTDGLPASDSIIEEVQNYIDPGGTGLGEGIANIGAKFTAAAPSSVPIDISVSVQTADGAVLDDVRLSIEEAVKEYLKKIVFASKEKNDVVVRIASIANIIYDLGNVIDYDNLMINSNTVNVTVSFTSVPTLGVVTVVQI